MHLYHFFHVNTLECISFEHFVKKILENFKKISFGRKSFVFLTKILKMKIFQKCPIVGIFEGTKLGAIVDQTLGNLGQNLV